MKDPKTFIRNLDLYEGNKFLRFNPLRKDRHAELEGMPGNEAILSFKSLSSFVSGVTPQHQEDVLNSTLLAQRAATKAFPDDLDIMDWYKKYFEVLTAVGWVVENREFATFKSDSKHFEIENAILEVLGTALTGNQLAVLTATIKAFKSLGEGDKRFLAFEQNTHSMQKGSFQLGIATEDNGTLSISTNAFIIKTSKTITKILFFKSDRDSTELLYNISKATLNESIYSDLRSLIKEKLGNIQEFVADLEV